ncbi:uncharacterized protein LOC131254356 [Magnolia sinica]|uniref:uncharacterized protein LOC131254356 n=1 Tax=Magnolia sinica TaxID=86752 RepID=UPI0026596BEF|nr:uncharacterized protein LOC131254356 [Magnolia sinica]
MKNPSIDQVKCEVVNPVETTPSWMDPIYDYLVSSEVSHDKLEAQHLKIRAAQYIILDGVLYKKGYSQPYLKCLRPEEADYVIREIHEGICGNHSGDRALALKILRQGYFWQIIRDDSKDYVRKYNKCHRFAAIPRRAGDVGPVTRPGRGLGISKANSSPRHQQSNGQVEAVNKVIKHHLKTKLEKVKGNWAEELLFVLWAYRTTSQSSTRETPFLLSYGSEAVVPFEIGLPIVRIRNYQESQNAEHITASHDLLEEARDTA